MDELIDRYLEQHRQEIIDAVCRLVRIPSVRSQATPDYPYGAACAQAIDFCIELAAGNGLTVRNYSYHCARLGLPFEGNGKDILFAAHADVVPADEKSSFPAFGGTVWGDYIIGRGAVDDKAPLIAALYALAFFSHHRISMKHRFSLLVGSDEESGMHDLDYYLAQEGQPDVALVVDDDFPVAKGEQGLIRFSVTGELTENVAEVCSKKRVQRLYPDSCSLVCANGESRSFLAEDRNPLTEMLESCYEKGIELFGEQQDIEIIKLVSNVCLSCIFAADPGERVDVIPTDFRMVGARTARLSFKLYFIHDMQAVLERLAEIFEGTGLCLEIEHASAPFLLEDDDPVVAMLTDLYNSNSGTRHPPYVIRHGVTYARKFRYACGFGAGNPTEKKPFPAGHGTTHGPDEAHGIETLFHAIKIYIKAIWEMELYDWDGVKKQAKDQNRLEILPLLGAYPL